MPSVWAGASPRAGSDQVLLLAILIGAESLVVNQGVKRLFKRTRPTADGEDGLKVRRPTTSSFPSGHSSAAAFAATMLATWDGKRTRRRLVHRVASIVGVSRAYVRIHHGSDVVGGFVVGTLLGCRWAASRPAAASRLTRQRCWRSCSTALAVGPLPWSPMSDIVYGSKMSDAEGLMWRLEKDPQLSSTFGTVTLLDRAPDFALLHRPPCCAPRLAMPRLRQRVQTAPGNIGAPTWVNDPDFDINMHVRRLALPKPGS